MLRDMGYWREAIDGNFANMRRCAKCILPETFPGISFNADGVCNYCLTYETVNVFGEQELENLLTKYKNKGKEYDCIAPISGGRDSSFVLYNLVKKYEMRVLALTVDSGFLTSEAVRNIERMTEILRVDHVWLRDTRKIQIAKKNVKTKFHGWLKNPSINMIVPVLNSGDKTMNLQMYKYAEKNEIPLVMGGNVVGNSTIEQDHWKTGYMGVFPDEHGVYSIPDRAKLFILFGFEFLRNPSNLRVPVLMEYAGGSIVYFFDPLLRPNGVDSLGYYDYVYWNEERILTTIRRELDWKGASDTTTTWRIDDSAYPLINYIYFMLVGFTEHDELYSKMIREGQISREEALRRCFSDHEPRIPSLMRAFEELEVTKEAVDEVLEEYGKDLTRKIVFGKKRNAVI